MPIETKIETMPGLGRRPEGSASAFSLMGAAEDAGFEPARACTQLAFQVCLRPVVNVQATARGGDYRPGNPV